MTDESNRITAAREALAHLVADQVALAERIKRTTAKVELRTQAHAEYIRVLGDADTPPRERL